jgi:hypothetical protein
MENLRELRLALMAQMLERYCEPRVDWDGVTPKALAGLMIDKLDRLEAEYEVRRLEIASENKEGAFGR